MGSLAKKISFYSFILINLVIISYFWYPSSGTLIGQDTSSTLIALARLFGLLGVLGILMQLLFIGRVRWLESVFGLDKLSRVHHWNGYATFSLLLSHALFLITGYSLVSNTSFLAQFISFITTWSGVLLAAIALSLLTAIIILSVIIVRRRLKYETWYLSHLLVYAVIVLAFFHQVNVGTDLNSSRYFMIYWYVLYGFVILNLLWFRFIRPVYISRKHDFQVLKVEKETENATSVYITGKDLDKLKIAAGQFMILRFFQKGFWTQAHPFSLSGYDFEKKKYLRLTIKSLGDFTSQVPRLKKGTRILIDGPHGIFTAKSAKRDRFLFIAGGVGITPLRSLAEEQLRKGRDITLLYGNRTKEEIIFKKELDALEKRYPKRLKVHHILSNDNKWRGERGYINKEKIARLAKDYAKREIYVCGPLAMMRTVIADLESLGADKRHIHHERFSL